MKTIIAHAETTTENQMFAKKFDEPNEPLKLQLAIWRFGMGEFFSPVISDALRHAAAFPHWGLNE